MIAVLFFVICFASMALMSGDNWYQERQRAVRAALGRRNFHNHITVNDTQDEDPAYIIATALASDGHAIRAETDADIYVQFNNFNRQFGRKHVSVSQKIERFRIFHANMRAIRNFNTTEDQTFDMAANQFADMTPSEFMALQGARLKLPESKRIQASTTDVDTEIDFRRDGLMTPVKDQGHCGSCWAFATTGVIESYFKRHESTNVTLSEQQLVDCVKECHGCEYGNSFYAYEYAQKEGICNSVAYPYVGEEGTCLAAPGERRFILHKFGVDEAPDLVKLMKQHGPLTVYVSVTPEWQFYHSGILNSCGTDVNHAVVLAGMGCDEDGPYWLIKNSWGTVWGEEGYVKLARGSSAIEHECGMSHMALYAIA